MRRRLPSRRLVICGTRNRVAASVFPLSSTGKSGVGRASDARSFGHASPHRCRLFTRRVPGTHPGRPSHHSAIQWSGTHEAVRPPLGHLLGSSHRGRVHSGRPFSAGPRIRAWRIVRRRSASSCTRTCHRGEWNVPRLQHSPDVRARRRLGVSGKPHLRVLLQGPHRKAERGRLIAGPGAPWLSFGVHPSCSISRGRERLVFVFETSRQIWFASSRSPGTP
jgi:hypothetical protein